MSIESRLFGRRDVFAIEVGLEVKRESRELGRICWWLSGRRVGDWEDTAYVVGCVNWHRDLLLEQKPQIVPELFDESPSEVFRIIYDYVYSDEPDVRKTDPYIEDRYRDFLISVVGMSSFEWFDIVMIKDHQNNVRFVWREAKSDLLFDCVFSANTVASVVKEFVDWYASLCPEASQ